MSRGFINEWPFKTRSWRGCTLDTICTSLTFTWGAISWSALSESTPHMFQWFPSHWQFPPATDSTRKCSCILVIILSLVAQFMASNMKQKVPVHIHVWQRKYHMYIELIIVLWWSSEDTWPTQQTTDRRKLCSADRHNAPPYCNFHPALLRRRPFWAFLLISLNLTRSFF